jgi:hypothetical protein
MFALIGVAAAGGAACGRLLRGKPGGGKPGGAAAASGGDEELKALRREVLRRETELAKHINVRMHRLGPA